MWLALRNWNLIIQASIIFSSCNQNKVILKPVSHSQFELFVNETNYVRMPKNMAGLLYKQMFTILKK